MGWIKKRINKEYDKHQENLDWGLLAEKKIIGSIMEYCWKNNTIKFKNSPIKLAILDGGWVNVIKLREFLECGILNTDGVGLVSDDEEKESEVK